MFYENIKSMKFKVLSSISYCIMENFVFVLIICVDQKQNFMLHVKEMFLRHKKKCCSRNWNSWTINEYNFMSWIFWIIQSQLSSCHVAANWLIIIFNCFVLLKKIQTPLKCVFTCETKNQSTTLILTWSFNGVLQRNLFCY